MWGCHTREIWGWIPHTERRRWEGLRCWGVLTPGSGAPSARLRYLDLYEEIRALSPPADAMRDVATKFGTVRVYRHGPAGRVPIVLLHGYFLTSAMWARQVAGLAGDFTVYTIDMPGQPGASMQSKSMRTPADCARCIDDVLTGLGLQDVHLVGYSYGGWLATHTAARFPQRLATMTLIDPASTGPNLGKVLDEPGDRDVMAAVGACSARSGVGDGWSRAGQLCRPARRAVSRGIRRVRATPGHADSALRQCSRPAFREYSVASSLGGPHCSRFVKGSPTDTRGSA